MCPARQPYACPPVCLVVQGGQNCVTERALFYLIFCAPLRRRTPGPPPFSLMNSMPAVLVPGGPPGGKGVVIASGPRAETTVRVNVFVAVSCVGGIRSTTYQPSIAQACLLRLKNNCGELDGERAGAAQGHTTISNPVSVRPKIEYYHA